MFTLVAYYLFSHIISFLCSILEAVLLCCTSSHIALLKKKNPRVGDIFEDLKNRIDRPLAAILTLNTSAHTFGAAGVGATVVELYGDQWLAFISVILTLTMLLFTEMIPKTLGALYWKRLTTFTAYFIKILIILTYPFVILFEYIARFLSRGKVDEKITTEEIRHILAESTRTGVLQEAEYDMVESILRLGNRRVGVLMIPRLDIEWLDLTESPEYLKNQIQNSPHHRFPLCKGELDEVIGFINTRTVLMEFLNKGSFDLASLARPSLFVPENMRVLQLLELFKKTPDHIAIVTDEYGGVQGLITLHDVLESIVGDLPASAPVEDTQIVKRKDGSWLIDGMLAIDEFKEEFDVESFPGEDRGVYRTIGGFCMYQLGTIPRVGDTFIWKKFKFKVIQMDGRRVERVLVTDAL
jgi:putative hemolysin